MRSGFVQVVCVVAIAFGAGLFAFGNYLRPPLSSGNAAEAVRYLDTNKADHFVAAASRGVGVGCITFGGLGLVVPWINSLVRRPDGSGDGTPATNSQ